MPNRCYLYAANFIPGASEPPGKRRIRGLGEGAYDVPLAFRLMVSSRPRLCESLIFDESTPTAIVGQFAAGLAALKRFLARLTHPAAQPLIAETLAFLSERFNQDQFVLLEPGEIYCYEDIPHREQAEALLEEIRRPEPLIEQMLSIINPPGPAKPSVWDLLRGRPPGVDRTEYDDQAAAEALEAVGLQGWSNILFCDLNT